MKKLLYFIAMSFFLALILAFEGKAQTSFTFGYDASGNRTSRTIALKSAFIPQNDTIAAKQKSLDDLIGNREVKIYPNPTKGLLRVEMPVIEGLSATIKVFSMQGILIKQLEINSISTEIDLSRQSPGIYIMRISIGELSSEWRIIKD